MTQKQCIKPAAALIGTLLAGTLLAVGSANAGENPFKTAQHQSAPMVLASNDGKCGEGKCSGEKKEAESKCSGEKKEAETKCSGEKKEKEGKCSGE